MGHVAADVSPFLVAPKNAKGTLHRLRPGFKFRVSWLQGVTRISIWMVQCFLRDVSNVQRNATEVLGSVWFQSGGPVHKPLGEKYIDCLGNDSEF